MSKKVIVSIGGNAIVKSNDSNSVEDQYREICYIAKHMVDMVADGIDLIVTHGNGPQAGLCMERAKAANQTRNLPLVPLVNCVADTQGGIGYQIQQALVNELRQRKIDKKVVTVITQVVVDDQDPEFKAPSKPIGSFFTQAEAEEIQTRNPDWTFIEDSGRGYRQVVPSPRPVDIVERDAIKTLIDAGYIVITVGGGGIPVKELADGSYQGIDAVIDKDHATSLLANLVGVETIVITTGVPKVCVNFGKADQKELDQVTIADVKRFIGEGQFAKGSMLPKIEASLAYLESSQGKVIITDLEHMAQALRGQAGTHIQS